MSNLPPQETITRDNESIVATATQDVYEALRKGLYQSPAQVAAVREVITAAIRLATHEPLVQAELPE